MISHSQRLRVRERARTTKHSLSRLGRGAVAAAVLASAFACGTPPKDRNPRGTDAGTGSGATTSTGSTGPGGSGASAGATVGTSGAGGTGNDAGNTGSSGSGAVGTNGGSTGMIEPGALLPQRIRRLANAEFDASVQAVTGTTKTPAKKFAPDARQNGFTLND